MLLKRLVIRDKACLLRKWTLLLFSFQKFLVCFKTRIKSTTKMKKKKKQRCQRLNLKNRKSLMK